MAQIDYILVTHLHCMSEMQCALPYRYHKVSQGRFDTEALLVVSTHPEMRVLT